jgi:hypoxanthine-DNA glycosylase
MTLHDAIEKILRQIGRPMTAREISDELNKVKWYEKGDKSTIKPNQISARVNDCHELFDIDRSVFPQQIRLLGKQSFAKSKTISRKTEKDKIVKSFVDTKSLNSKISFGPISSSDTCILILGTMPGDKSIELNEYYGHPRNKFWKIISTITNNDLPTSYSDKKSLLLKTKIGIWDVAHTVNRQGSLDNAIQDEEPNDLTTFISKHKELKVIGFNGTKAETLFDKYFTRQKETAYISLPSTSPANTGINFDSMCKHWQLVLK